MVYECGTSVIGGANIERIATLYKNSPPTTRAEMYNLFGTPTGTSSDENGEYSFWESYPVFENGAAATTSMAGCLSKGGKIVASYLCYLKPPSYEKRVVIGTNISEYSHPGMMRAVIESNKKVCTNRSFYQGREVIFSPSGRKGVFLEPGQRLLGWSGDTPHIVGPEPVVQQSTGSSLGATLVSGILTSLPGAISNVYGGGASAMAVPAAAPRSPNNNAMMEDSNYLQRKADESAEKVHQMQLEKARRSAPRFYGYDYRDYER